MSVSDITCDQKYLDDAFDRAEQYEQDVADLATRARLACATATMCDNFIASLRRAHAVMLRGEPLDLAAAKQMLDEHCDDAIRNFIRAWRATADMSDRMLVVQTAVISFVEGAGVVAEHFRPQLTTVLQDFALGAARSI